MLRKGLSMNEIVEKLKDSNRNRSGSSSTKLHKDENEKFIIEKKREFMR